MTDDDLKKCRVSIVDRRHPHFPEGGLLTGKIISVLGQPMTELRLDNCRHGTDGCFVSKGQIAFDPQNMVKGAQRKRV